MRIIFAIFLSFIFGVAYGDQQPLPPEQAFELTANLDSNRQIILQWKLAPGYYLYKDRVKIQAQPNNQITLGKIFYPDAITKQSPTKKNIEVYSKSLKIIVPVANQQGWLNLSVGYQGCSENGFCYSPMKKKLHVDLRQISAPANLTSNIIVQEKKSETISSHEYAKNIFNGHNRGIIFLSFLGLGLLLAFSPCVLPMIPILSGIIFGHRKKQLTTAQTFFLSFAYVLGVAVTYAAAGVVIALLGSHIQTELQRPWVIILFSGIFVLLALSLFGFYQLQLPPRWQQRLTQWSNKQKGGTYIGVFLMGSISSLIISPCISPPLIGVLAYIAQTGNVWLGALALFALGLGMGAPLLLIGASAGKLLPKAGAWMETMERIVGILLLAYAIWLLSRVIPGSIILFLWAMLLSFSGAYLLKFSNKNVKTRLLSLCVATLSISYGIVLLAGSFFGSTDPLHPWEKITWFNSKAPIIKEQFFTVKTLQELKQEFLRAKQDKKYILIDFYADWCESCIWMDKNVFNQSEVQKYLENYVTLRVDVTRNNRFDQEILESLDVIAPPTILFFDSAGGRLNEYAIFGEMNKRDFLLHLEKIIQKE